MLFELLKGGREKNQRAKLIYIVLGATFTMKSRNSFRTFEKKKRKRERKETKLSEIVPKFLHFFIRFLPL